MRVGVWRFVFLMNEFLLLWIWRICCKLGCLLFFVWFELCLFCILLFLFVFLMWFGYGKLFGLYFVWKYVCFFFFYVESGVVFNMFWVVWCIDGCSILLFIFVFVFFFYLIFVLVWLLIDELWWCFVFFWENWVFWIGLNFLNDYFWW